MKFSSGLAICASSLPFWEHKRLEVTSFLICVYTPDCTDFSGNGIGPVAPMSCTVTETLNGEWELTLTHPLDDAGKWRRLVEGCILRAPVPAAMTPGITMVTQATPEVKREVWKVRTNGSRLMLRSGTGTKYKIIGKYHNGTEVVLLEKTTSSWYKMLTPDGKQGYASVECVERGLNPLTANLLVADETRSDKTICLAVSPSLKAMGVPSRPRLFEAKQAIRLYEAQHLTKVECIIAKPQMALYEKVSAKIYSIYLKYIATCDTVHYDDYGMGFSCGVA